MKLLLCLSVIFVHAAMAQSISGVVKITGKAPKGTLFIFAKKYKSKMPMPIAVKKIENPKFPLKFELSAKNAMMKNIPFKGPFKVTARISPSGGAMDKSGVEVSTKKRVDIGDKSIELVLP